MAVVVCLQLIKRSTDASTQHHTLLILFAVAVAAVKVDRMALHRRIRVLAPNLDRLVGLSRDEARARLVKGGGEDAALRLERSRLRDRLERLEVVARLVVPHVYQARVARGGHHAVLVEG